MRGEQFTSQVKFKFYAGRKKEIREKRKGEEDGGWIGSDLDDVGEYFCGWSAVDK